MVEIGKHNDLKITKIENGNLIVDAEEFGEIIVENTELALEFKEGQIVNVFLFPESDGSASGFMGPAYACINEFARLRVVSNTNVGAFFDLGLLGKDLFCPFKEQKTELEQNKYYSLYIYLDTDTNRLVASTKIEKFISDEAPLDIQEQEDVEAFIINKSQIGYNAIVNNKYQGLLYFNEVFSELNPGQKINAVVKKIREDNKIDLRMFKNDHNDIKDFESLIVNYLMKHKGKMSINDESDPEVIYSTFGISKKNFKKALGSLYRKQIIDLKDTLVILLKV